VELLKRQERIRKHLRHGRSLDEVEEEIIDPAPLDQEHKAALWLYAWSEMPRRRRRTEVRRPSGYLADHGGTP
jgi:hypothetical protein